MGVWQFWGADGVQGARDLKGVYSKRVENTDFYTKEKIPLDKMKWNIIICAFAGGMLGQYSKSGARKVGRPV